MIHKLRYDEKRSDELEWFLEIEQNEVHLKAYKNGESWYVFKVDVNGVGHLAEDIDPKTPLQLDSYGAIKLGDRY